MCFFGVDVVDNAVLLWRLCCCVDEGSLYSCVLCCCFYVGCSRSLAQDNSDVLSLQQTLH